MSELQRFALHPVHVDDRISIVYLERGILVREGHSLVLQTDDEHIVVPVGITATLMLGPGTSVTHAAVALCAAEGALLLWVGEGCVRLYAAGEPRGRPEHLLRQAVLAASEASRLAVARRLFRQMFDEEAPPKRSIEQLRGIEGSRVKKLYAALGAEFGVDVERIGQRDMGNPIVAALAGLNAALYGLTEAVILSLGYSPSMGFVHTGDPRSFVFDLADTVKFKTVVPAAFRLARESEVDLEKRSRTAARQVFKEEGLAGRLVSILGDVLRADGLS